MYLVVDRDVVLFPSLSLSLCDVPLRPNARDQSRLNARVYIGATVSLRTIVDDTKPSHSMRAFRGVASGNRIRPGYQLPNILARAIHRRGNRRPQVSIAHQQLRDNERERLYSSDIAGDYPRAAKPQLTHRTGVSRRVNCRSRSAR